MPTYTTNYNLKKPTPEDYYNIADFNGNMDIIDTQLKQNINAMVGPNILINADFRNPINQRGETSYAVPNFSSFIYTIDRWKLTGGTVSIVDGGITIQKAEATSHASLSQILEYPPANTQTLTLSVKLDGAVLTATGTAGTWFAVQGTGIYLDFYQGKIVRIVATDTQVHTIEWVKLEYGEVATPFVSRQYGEELALCQRYFVSLNPLAKANIQVGSVGTGHSNKTSVKNILVPLPVTMRIMPILQYTGSWNLSTMNANNAVTDISVLPDLSSAINSVCLNVTSANPIEINAPYTLWSYNDATANITLDAEL